MRTDSPLWDRATLVSLTDPGPPGQLLGSSEGHRDLRRHAAAGQLAQHPLSCDYNVKHRPVRRRPARMGGDFGAGHLLSWNGLR
jgi:hypothetical protein